jgi:hypothetical protein
MRPLPTQENTNREQTQTSMPRVGFEPTIPLFEREKTVHATNLRIVCAYGNVSLKLSATNLKIAMGRFNIQ